MSDDDFFILTVENLSQAEADLVAADAFENGAQGTEEALDFIQKNREYEPETIIRERTALKIYFLTPPDSVWIENLKNHYPNTKVCIDSEKNRDWLLEWKKGFHPFCLAGEVWVVPSWCKAPAEAKKTIQVDPGMAFGTGTHETTRLAAGLINDFAPQMLVPAGASLFDVGTGTGILAILAEIKGFTDVRGNDNDPEACRVARENVELNQSKVKIVNDDIAIVMGAFTCVVANIIDGVLVKLQADLKRCVCAGGFLIMTGILEERESLFREEFSFAGFKEVERRQLGEWVGILLQKK